MCRFLQSKTLTAAMVAMIVTAVGAFAQAQQTNQYFTGDGGKGIRLAVLEPTGKGFSENDKWMLSLVQGSISGDFNKFSGITIIDRQNFEKILGEWEESMSGNYSDADRAKIGNLTNASHILTGNINKTASSFIIEFYVTDVQSGERKASYSPKPVSLLALENLSAVKEASADLLTQLGVKLTDAAITQLKKVENAAKIQAETALAHGIRAQKQGTEVAALSYFFQAAALDPSLAEAVNRSSVMSKDVSSGNIGENTRNDIAWRKAWVARLEEAERSIDNINKTVSMPYTLYYSDEIIQGDVNYNDETVTLSIKTTLNGSNSIKIWALSVERALQAVYNGLWATKRTKEWGLDRWPRRCVTDLNPFEKQSRNFTIVAELVNSRNMVIGSQEFRVGGYWTYNAHTDLDGRMSVILGVHDLDDNLYRYDGRKDVKFTNVKTNDITDNLTIRFASVNGEAAETAAQKGILQIKAMRKSEFDANNQYAFTYGEIKKYEGTGGNIVIPNTILDNPVTAIGENAFHSKLLLTSVIIPNSVTSIGSLAFFQAGNNLISITIGKNVTLSNNAFGSNSGFAKIYQDNGSKAGTYIYNGKTWVSGEMAEKTKVIETLIDMVSVQGGRFIMGCTKEQGNDCENNEKPEHQVTVKNFQIGKHEVTQKLWKLVMDGNPSTFKGDNLPVENVSWDDIQSFISKLNTITGKKYRLPTEAEWEYAARGGNKSKGYKYSGSNNIGDVGWYIANSGDKPVDGEIDITTDKEALKREESNNHKTRPVGTKRPNELGIYDMSGNVLEWVNDWYVKYSEGSQINPNGPKTGTHRVIRGGGSWLNNAKKCRIPWRNRFAPDVKGNILGFRLAHD